MDTNADQKNAARGLNLFSTVQQKKQVRGKTHTTGYHAKLMRRDVTGQALTLCRQRRNWWADAECVDAAGEDQRQAKTNTEGKEGTERQENRADPNTNTRVELLQLLFCKLFLL